MPYIIGHKSPDLDSAAAAISYAELKNKLAGSELFKPATAGEVNRETEYALNKFGFKKPEVLMSVQGQELILVDHNEASQSADNIGEAKILEVIDHHKVNFQYAEPIKFLIEPWGSSCSIIYNEFKKNNLAVSKELAGLMLSAVLVDTVITKSPTCTAIDKEIIDELAKIAEIENWQEYGMELFQVRSSVKELSPMEIIKSDFKDFEFKNGKFGIGQVETVDLGEFVEKEEGILEELASLQKDGGYAATILFITDIIKEGSLFLVSAGGSETVEQAMGEKLENNKVYIEGIISRKKQVAPKFAEAFDK